MPGVRREKPRDWSKYPELCDLIAGKAPSRTTDKQITFFLNNVGTGVQFAAMGYCAYKARQRKKPGPRDSERVVHAGYQTVTWIC